MQADLLNAVRAQNDSRTTSNQTYIGVLFFLVALGMVQYACSVALIQAYVLPMRRFEHVSSVFASTKLVALIYAAVLIFAYFLISTTGGMTGFIVSSSVLILWAASLIVVGTIRRFIRYAEPIVDNETEEESGSEVSAPPMIKTSSGGTVNRRHTRNNAAPTQPAASVEPAAPAAAKRAVPRPSSKRTFVFRRLRRSTDPWTSSPTPMKTSQLGCIFASSLALLVNLMTILLIVYLWDIQTYQLVTRDDQPIQEVMPSLTAKALQFMYAYPEFAQKFQLDVYTKLFTEYCGATYSLELDSHSAKSDAIQPWIDGYKVNMSEAVRPNLDDYFSVNDWFTRAIDMSLRPLPNNTRALTAPSDSRVTAFQTITQSRNFFKGYNLNWKDLINRVVVNNDPEYFANGMLLIFRMAPQDYHRFHMPINGTIASVTSIPGTLWSVGNDAVGSGNAVFLNQRTLVLINTTTASGVGTIALVAIGATCVGSVVMELADGTPVTKGMFIPQGAQIGYMQFGGSTVAMLLRSSSSAVVDSSILYRSTFPVETLVRVNQAIASYS